MKILEMGKELLKSSLVTVALLVIVVSLQLEKCSEPEEHATLSAAQTKEIVSSIRFDTQIIDSIITARKDLFYAIANMDSISLKNQDSITAKQREILVNQKDMLRYQEEIKEFQIKILDMANRMKNLPQYKEYYYE